MLSPTNVALFQLILETFILVALVGVLSQLGYVLRASDSISAETTASTCCHCPRNREGYYVSSMNYVKLLTKKRTHLFRLESVDPARKLYVWTVKEKGTEKYVTVAEDGLMWDTNVLNPHEFLSEQLAKLC